jgi:hypothetical protein
LLPPQGLFLSGLKRRGRGLAVTLKLGLAEPVMLSHLSCCKGPNPSGMILSPYFDSFAFELHHKYEISFPVVENTELQPPEQSIHTRVLNHYDTK